MNLPLANSVPALDETQRSILAFLGRHYPYETNPLVFETRAVLTGELRLALHEYDEACRGLVEQRLIQTDPPQAHDCDAVALTRAGRRAITRPPQAGSLPQRLLEQVQRGRGWLTATELMAALDLPDGEGGMRQYQAACEVLYAWGLIQCQAQGANCYAKIQVAS